MSHVERLARLQGNRCFLCGGPLAEPVNVDHVIPKRISEARSKPWNRAATHQACNERKRDRLPTIDELDRLAALHNVRIGRAVRIAYTNQSEPELTDALLIPGPSEYEAIHGYAPGAQ